MEEYIKYYNTQRITTKLKGLTPVQFRNQSKYPPTSVFVDTLLQIVWSKKSTPVDGIMPSFYNDYGLYRRRFYLWIKMINYLFLY